MEFLILVLIGCSVALDCFAVSACIASVQSLNKKLFFSIPLHFAGFQIGMALLGYYFGFAAKGWIVQFNSWVAFAILTAIGIKIIVESVKESHDSIDASSEWKIIMLAIATSIDALVIGLALSVESVNLLTASIIIGSITFLLSVAGLLLGRKIHDLRIGYIGVVGGLVLIGIGVKTLLQHLL
jgi:manganese efflux pump family protein